jgi:hypothetical protein
MSSGNSDRRTSIRFLVGAFLRSIALMCGVQSRLRHCSVRLGEQVGVWLVLVGYQSLARQMERVSLLRFLVAVACAL